MVVAWDRVPIVNQLGLVTSWLEPTSALSQWRLRVLSQSPLLIGSINSTELVVAWDRVSIVNQLGLITSWLEPTPALNQWRLRAKLAEITRVRVSIRFFTGFGRSLQRPPN